MNLPFNKSGLRLSSWNVFVECNGEFWSLRSTTKVSESCNVVLIFFNNNESSANEDGASASSCSWLGGLDCSEIGVGGSDNFFWYKAALLIVDLVTSPATGICCGRSVDVNGAEACKLSFDISCFCFDGVIVNEPNGCRTCALAVGWVNVKFEGFPDCKLLKENRGTFADDGLGKEWVEAFVDDEFVNWTDGIGPDVNPCENEVPNGDPVLA